MPSALLNVLLLRAAYIIYIAAGGRLLRAMGLALRTGSQPQSLISNLPHTDLRKGFFADRLPQSYKRADEKEPTYTFADAAAHSVSTYCSHRT